MKKIFLILCLLLPLSLQAVPVQKLYEVEVAVADQSSGERLKGMSAAIKEVLVRLSGNKAIVGEPVLASAIASPGRYVKGYRYERREQATVELDFLLVSFSPKALQGLLVENQLPIWPEQRTDVLVWLAVDERARPYIIKDNPLNIINQAINDAAINRGLPLSWPLDSDIDSGKVRATDIKAGFQQQIISASKDYAAHGILIGYLKKLSKDKWQGEWQLVRQDKAVNWSSDIASLDDVMLSGVDPVADTLASEFSILGGDEQGLLLVNVRNINNLESYAVSRAYLQDLLITSDVGVVKVMNDAVDYQLRLRGKAGEFVRAINLGGKMRIVPKVIVTQNIDPESRLETTTTTEPDYVLELIP